MSGNDFWTSGTGNGKFHSHFREWNASGKFHSRLSGRELEAGIPGNSRDREFPLMVDMNWVGWFVLARDRLEVLPSQA